MDVSPEEQACPACQHPLNERDPKQRWIMRLDQPVQVVSHVLEGGKTACTRPAGVDRPRPEEALALRGDAFGLDVVARLGAWRYQHHVSMTKMRDQRQTASPLAISRHEVALRGEVFLALVTTVAHHDEERIRQWRTLDGLVRAIDGVQPEKSPETLDMLRDVRSGRV